MNTIIDLCNYTDGSLRQWLLLPKNVPYTCQETPDRWEGAYTNSAYNVTFDGAQPDYYIVQQDEDGCYIVHENYEDDNAEDIISLGDVEPFDLSQMAHFCNKHHLRVASAKGSLPKFGQDIYGEIIELGNYILSMNCDYPAPQYWYSQAQELFAPYLSDSREEVSQAAQYYLSETYELMYFPC